MSLSITRTTINWNDVTVSRTKVKWRPENRPTKGDTTPTSPPATTEPVKTIKDGKGRFAPIALFPPIKYPPIIECPLTPIKPIAETNPGGPTQPDTPVCFAPETV